jgi:hypothetical protein
VAPQAEIFGPEVCVGMAWWSTVSRQTCDLDPVFYSNDFPFHDFIENYSEVFDSLTISFYGIAQSDLNLQLNNCLSTRVRETAGVGLSIARDNALPKSWTYGEVGWGSKDGLDTLPGVSDGLDEVHFAWASTLFGLDHSRGILVWQAKGNEGSRAGIWNQNGSVNTEALQAWRVMGPVINENADFLSTYHSRMNADNFPTDDDTLFVENDVAVLTRKLAHHVIIYSEGPTSLSFSGVDSLDLSTVYSGGAVPSVTKVSDRVRMFNLTPMRLYIMEILSGPEPTVFRRGDVDLSGKVDFTDAIVEREFIIPGLGSIECEDAADSNEDGAVDFSDAIYTLTVIFLGGTIPSPGTNSCGVDPTPDALDCGTYPVACP